MFKRVIIPMLAACIFIPSSTGIMTNSNLSGRMDLFASNNSLQDKQLNETARFFAGKKLDGKSSLFRYTQNSFYKKYLKRLNLGWNKFQKPNLIEMKKWWVKHAPSSYHKKIIYPFSGPDVMNALTLFPDGNLYIMFGLEQPGIIPEPHGMKNRAITSGLRGILHSLQTIFRYNFFRTLAMEKNLGNRSFNGVTSLLMLFLSLNEYEITGVKRIAIDAGSSLVPGISSDNKIRWKFPPKSKRIPGVEIAFRKSGGKEQTLRYFMLNVIDYSLKKGAPNFIPYLKKEGPYTTVIKSASYLMHNDKIKFTKIRAALLETSLYIVQDDSGVPLRYLPAAAWKIQYHGFYYRPISLFSSSYQKELRINMKKKSTGLLPFSYGYNFKLGKSNLMTVERVKQGKQLVHHAPYSSCMVRFQMQ